MTFRRSPLFHPHPSLYSLYFLRVSYVMFVFLSVFPPPSSLVLPVILGLLFSVSFSLCSQFITLHVSFLEQRKRRQKFDVTFASSHNMTNRWCFMCVFSVSFLDSTFLHTPSDSFCFRERSWSLGFLSLCELSKWVTRNSMCSSCVIEWKGREGKDDEDGDDLREKEREREWNRTRKRLENKTFQSDRIAMKKGVSVEWVTDTRLNQRPGTESRTIETRRQREREEEARTTLRLLWKRTWALFFFSSSLLLHFSLFFR